MKSLKLFFFFSLIVTELSQLEDLQTSRIVRILTVDFPHYFAVVSRIRQEVHAVGPEGGTVSSSAVPQVQAIFPAAALTKKIRVGLQVFYFMYTSFLNTFFLYIYCKYSGNSVLTRSKTTLLPPDYSQKHGIL